MRRVFRSYSRKPAILKSSKTLQNWERIALSGNVSLINPNFYSDPYKTTNGNGSRVLDKLAIWYKGKCAYCERRYKLDVDHFRPKGRITDESGSVIALKGYYWLCYEWSNLLPACISCNREGGKLDKFPIMGTRVSVPQYRNGRLVRSRCNVSHLNFITERPYLINPEIDNPENFFSFRISDNGNGVEIYGIDSGNRGNLTMNICKLNRLEIRIERAKIILEFVESIHSLFKLFQNGMRNQTELRQGIDNLLQTLHDQAKNEELTHTLFRKFISKNSINFNSLVLPFVAQNLRKIVQSAYSNFTPV